MKNGEKYKTVEERKEPFRRFCNSRLCVDCEISSRRLGERECGLFWLELEAEEKKPLPCPFCGEKTRITVGVSRLTIDAPVFVVCDNCGYTSGNGTSMDNAVARHNALCRRLKGGES